LEKRLNDGLLVIFEKDDFKMILGPEAVSLKQELDKRTDVGGMTQGILNGQTACQGYAKGIARIILNEKDFATLKEGEILVTGMTRPEFLPLMKLAAGIVTNEGGVTCHAAIVSRELNKPCIIGTKNATEMIKNGDLVEVRATHGTVRILS
jgi:pyruvate,water dikinase